MEIGNSIINNLKDFCELLTLNKEESKFDEGYNYALMLVQVKLENIERYLKVISIKKKEGKESGIFQ